jgi:hypothetical protein
VGLAWDGGCGIRRARLEWTWMKERVRIVDE